MAFGLSFLPGENDQPGASGDPGGNVSGDRVQQAVRLLNLRLPRVQGGGAPVPNALLQARGGQPGMDSAMSLQALQRLMQLMAGMGGAQPGYGQQAYGGTDPRVTVGQGLPPGMPEGISPPGPPNLPPMAPPMGINPPGPPNLPPTMVRSHGGPNDPMAEFLRTNGGGRGRGPLSPPGPKNLPPTAKPLPKPIVSHGPGSGARPTAPRLPRVGFVDSSGPWNGNLPPMKPRLRTI